MLQESSEMYHFCQMSKTCLDTMDLIHKYRAIINITHGELHVWIRVTSECQPCFLSVSCVV